MVRNNFEPSGQILDNSIPTGFLQLKELDVTGCFQHRADRRRRGQDFVHVTSLSEHRKLHQRSRTAADDGTEDLSHFDEIEVSACLLKEEEKHYKRIIWEALNTARNQVKRPKRAGDMRKDKSLKRALETFKEEETKRSSLKINYEALEEFNEELVCSLDS